ncbi:hypothetical protein AZK14_06330 [Streptococcus pneumoniae]|nr:hypothetical protein AZK14_06330 [Streptococcus pneumoniae]
MSLFIIGHMGLFFYTKISSIISIGDLPTTNIIEPDFSIYFVIGRLRYSYFLQRCCLKNNFQKF